MARPYANDLRERVVALVLGGSTTRAAAARMQVSVASAVRWAQAARATGSAAAKPMGGKRPYLLAGQRDFLLARLAEIGAAYREVMGRSFPAMTLVEVKALLADRARIEIETTAVVPDP